VSTISRYLPWRRRAVDRDDARRAFDEAIARADRTERVAADAARLADRLLWHRQENHFAPRLDAAYRRMERRRA